MPSKKNYPKGFSPYSQPRLYTPKPKDQIEEDEVLEEATVSNYESLELPEGTKKIYIERCHAYDEDFFKITCYGKNSVKPNPNYEKEMSHYQKELAKHKVELADWKKWKKKWDEEEAQEKEASERRQYEKLKVKFEKPSSASR